MNKMAMFFCLLLSVGIVTSYCQSEQTNEVIQSNPSNALKTPFNTKLPADRSGLFDIELKIDEVDKDQYDLSATIELEGESYVISPFSKDEIYDVTFTISNNSGVLAVKKMKTSISKEYRW